MVCQGFNIDAIEEFRGLSNLFMYNYVFVSSQVEVKVTLRDVCPGSSWPLFFSEAAKTIIRAIVCRGFNIDAKE